ncbi:MAG: ABC transporter ATP-binding protein [Leptolyngbya sp. DLM2.Bin15]|nr:MAG: ABC transporter ATP-binding protein [Leptolyngbya sp. DLM2.Bin15]
MVSVSQQHRLYPTSANPTVIVQLNELTKYFPRLANPAADAVSLTLEQGELLALLGPSGCGKTTLLRLIAGFEQPDAGQIAIAGQVVSGDGCWQGPEHRGIGMVFQDYALFPHLTVFDNIAFGLPNTRGKAKMERRRRVVEAIALVGLDGMEQRYPHELSGGQQQRVALARALAPRPLLVLLDEPLSNLDVQVRLRLRQELRAILKKAGTTAIFVTHDQEEALSMADRVGVMNQGCLEQVGTPEELYQHPQSRFVADFVTQANFLPAQRQGNLWHTEIGDFPLTDVEIHQPQDVTTTIDVMLRQEDVQIQPDETSSIVVSDRQFLGRDQRYSLTLPSGKSLSVLASSPVHLPIGARVRVTPQAAHLHGYPHRLA